MPRTLSPAARIERSILSDFRKPLWRPFVRGIKQYKMIAPGDHIAVCISGGKDSMLLAKMMQLLQRHTDIPFETEFLVMDPGYNAENRQRIIDNAALMEIPIRIFDSSIFETTKIAERNPCYLCARMRRGFLYDRAQEMGCNKIALGHHFNDVVETTVMGMFYGAQLQAMLPKLHSRNFPGMELIRPMYCIHEEDICRLARFQRPALYRLRLPPDRRARQKRRRHRQLEARGNQAAAENASGDEPRCREERLQRDSRRQSGHHAGLENRRKGIQFPG